MKQALLLLAIFLLVFSFDTVHAADLNKKKILGTWDFSAPDAPYPYTKGLLTLKEADNKLTGEFIVENQKIPINEVKIEGDEVSISFIVEQTPIIAKFKLVDSKLQGKADSPDGPIIVSAIKK